MKRPFEEIVVQHGPTVLRVCRAVLARPDAEDAWSETFLAALRAYPDLADGANVEAWLITIAHRKAIDSLRAQSRRAAPVGEIAETASTTVGTWQPPDDSLWAALRALPTKQRQAVAYHHVAGLSYAEVATIIGGSSEAARRAASDGIRALRRRYQSDELAFSEGIHS